jgi:hypothetical protein
MYKLLLIVFLLFGCKTTKKADCDAYGYHKKKEVNNSKTHKIKENVR